MVLVRHRLVLSLSSRMITFLAMSTVCSLPYAVPSASADASSRSAGVTRLNQKWWVAVEVQEAGEEEVEDAQTEQEEDAAAPGEEVDIGKPEGGAVHIIVLGRGGGEADGGDGGGADDGKTAKARKAGEVRFGEVARPRRVRWSR